MGFPFQVSQDISMLPGQATLIGPCSLFSEMRTVDLSVKNTQMLWDVLVAGWRKEFSKSDKTPRVVGKLPDKWSHVSGGGDQGWGPLRWAWQ